MALNLLLDIDGVVCGNGKPISEDMDMLLWELADHDRNIYFVTGNSFTQAKDKLNGIMLQHPVVEGIFCNNADEFRSFNGKLIWKEKVIEPIDWRIEDFLWDWIYKFPKNFYTRHGNHLEWRSPRFLNFSLFGRMSPDWARENYLQNHWKPIFIRELSKEFPDLDVFQAGSISIDICAKGANKSRAGRFLFNNNQPFIFIGDKTAEGGNDYPLAKFCEETGNKCLTVSSPSDTLKILKGCLNGEE